MFPCIKTPVWKTKCRTKDLTKDALQEQVGMDCLALLSDADLQLLGVTSGHRQLMKEAIANLQLTSQSGDI